MNHAYSLLPTLWCSCLFLSWELYPSYFLHEGVLISSRSLVFNLNSCIFLVNKTNIIFDFVLKSVSLKILNFKKTDKILIFWYDIELISNLVKYLLHCILYILDPLSYSWKFCHLIKLLWRALVLETLGSVKYEGSLGTVS